MSRARGREAISTDGEPRRRCAPSPLEPRDAPRLSCEPSRLSVLSSASKRGVRRGPPRSPSTRRQGCPDARPAPSLATAPRAHPVRGDAGLEVATRRRAPPRSRRRAVDGEPVASRRDGLRAPQVRAARAGGRRARVAQRVPLWRHVELEAGSMLEQQPHRGDDALPCLRDRRRARAMAVDVAFRASTRGGLRPSIVAAGQGGVGLPSSRFG